MTTSPSLRVGLGIAALTVSLGISLTACSSKAPSSSPTRSSDYSSLLLNAADIPVAGVIKGTAAAPQQGNGATVAFTAAGGRTLGDTVMVLPDASAAQAAAHGSIAAAKQSISGAVVTPALIGAGGTAIRGTNTNGAVALLIFTEGRALVVLEFNSSATDLVPTSVIQRVAVAQDSKITSGLHS